MESSCGTNPEEAFFSPSHQRQTFELPYPFQLLDCVALVNTETFQPCYPVTDLTESQQ